MYKKSDVILYLIVMWWQLVKQLFKAIFLSRAVYIGNLLFWQKVIILMHLKHKTSCQHKIKILSYVTQILNLH